MIEWKFLYILLEKKHKIKDTLEKLSKIIIE